MAVKKYKLEVKPNYQAGTSYCWQLPPVELDPKDNKTVLVVKGMDLSVDWLNSPDTKAITAGSITWRLLEELPEQTQMTASAGANHSFYGFPAIPKILSEAIEICRCDFAIAVNAIDQLSVSSSVILPAKFEMDCDEMTTNFSPCFQIQIDTQTMPDLIVLGGNWVLGLDIFYETKKLSDVEYFKLSAQCCQKSSQRVQASLMPIPDKGPM